jgi:TatD DNase family protein
MELFDTHCHMQSILSSGERHTRESWGKEPDLTPENIIQAAEALDVRRFLLVGCDVADSRAAIDLARQSDTTWATIGIHPHEANRYVSDQGALDTFAGYATEPKVVAIGECGLDYFYTHSEPAMQATLLRFQIELALTHNLPLVFHVREAFADFWPIFESYSGIRGVLHSFTDSRENLDRAIGHGLKFGVNGIVTFVKDPAQLEVYRAMPASSIVLETDAPFLTPNPYRGRVNQSKYVRTTAEFLATLRGESLTDLATISTQTARELFDV